MTATSVKAARGLTRPGVRRHTAGRHSGRGYGQGRAIDQATTSRVPQPVDRYPQRVLVSDGQYVPVDRLHVRGLSGTKTRWVPPDVAPAGGLGVATGVAVDVPEAPAVGDAVRVLDAAGAAVGVAVFDAPAATVGVAVLDAPAAMVGVGVEIGVPVAGGLGAAVLVGVGLALGPVGVGVGPTTVRSTLIASPKATEPWCMRYRRQPGKDPG